jgi:hypothetical protein
LNFWFYVCWPRCSARPALVAAYFNPVGLSFESGLSLSLRTLVKPAKVFTRLVFTRLNP